jgi:DNA polymerase
MRILTLDFETRSAIGLNSYRRYATHPSTGVLCIGLQFHDMAIGRVWTPPRGPVALPGDPCPPEVLLALEKGWPIYAHNVAFDRTMWEHYCVRVLGWPSIPFEQWRCTMSICCYYAIPAALEKAANALKLTHRKQKKSDNGRTALSQCSQPRPPRLAEKKAFAAQGLSPAQYPLLWYEDPMRLGRVYTYCGKDIGAQTELLLRLGELPPDRLADWQLDQKINERGVPVDLPNLLCTSMLVEGTLEQANEELRHITDKAVSSVSSRKQMQEYLWQYGVEMLSMDKESVEGALESDRITGNPRRVLELRQLAGKSSLSKVEAMLDYVDPDGRVRHGLRWHGAATGRWTGQGVQWHNFPRECLKEKDANELFALMEQYGGLDFRPYVWFAQKHKLTGIPDLLSRLLRALVRPNEGALLVSDFTAVESRVLAWLANCRLLQQAFGRGECVYCQFATRATGKVVVKGMDERQLGKVAVLGLGYQMGAVKFKDAAAGPLYKIDLDDEKAAGIVKLFRSTYPEIPKLWADVENAMIAAIENQVEIPIAGGKLACGSRGQWAWIRLPSGRRIWYYEPQIKLATTPWGQRKKQMTYMSVDSKTKAWLRTDTYGGKLIENATQATAADLLSAAIRRLEERDLFPIVSVHDEVVSEHAEAEAHFKAFHSCMEEVPDWASGCYVGAESRVAKRYGK